ncbi:purine-nucleoside phosphorylase [Algoriphagus halophytocola]|uniref:Purine nucleoside phosphorylase n=1 Tax=Algoriphagus halophytocola TaxID=2991499 RepID=A0ABY6MBR4_9BACT|nr:MULTISPECIES: purine-nucleoside phosphorylase [unclassified Algoriphagus]UZD21066.1 purine-nucleoside phosphorylase [Algoriphagus sp. TR-M5]WBL42232.1 purine-nucleoside phosphorylase [Algoriphagus sp. TR-M9]
MNYLNQIAEATKYIQSHFSEPVSIGIILGTGLGKLGDQITIAQEIDYADIPHFPVSTVESHSGKLIFGELSGKKVMAMRGRFHYYEGYTMQEVTFPIRVMKNLGVKTLCVSNASGGLNPAQEVGDVMILRDHIDLFPENPLRGKHFEEFGPRFPDMSDAYSSRLIAQALGYAQRKGYPVHTGVYAGVQGPNLETPAEYKYIRSIGADAVGMSTVPEVIVSRQMGIEVFGISAITDLGVEGKIKAVTIAEVLAAAAKAEPIMADVIKELVRVMD